MTKHECELMKRLMDENEQLRAKVRMLEQAAVASPTLQSPVPQIWPTPVPQYWPYSLDDPFSTRFLGST